MATKRIKDISTTATTFAADDFIALDASSVGTRKMAKASLITQVGANYLEKADNLSDVASKDTSKLNLEVPNVGTAANEVSVNGMLGDMSFQSSAGVVVDDLTVDGELTAAVGKPMPVNGPTMRFDGVNDYVEFADNDAFSFTNGTDDLPFSISAWVKFDNVTANHEIISKYSIGKEWRLFHSLSNGVTLRINDGTNFSDLYSGTLLSPNQWYFLGVTFGGAGPNSSNAFTSAMDAGNAELYVNGSIIASPTRSNNASYAGMSDTTETVKLGRTSTTYTKGEIRDAKLFNKELSAAEVREVYSNGQLPESFAESTGAIAYAQDSTPSGEWSATNVTASDEAGPISGRSNILKLLVSSGNSTHYVQDAKLTSEKRFKVTGSYYIPSSNSNADGFRVGTNTSTDLGVSISAATLDAWTDFSCEFTSNAVNLRISLSDGGSQTFDDSGGNDAAYFDNIRVTQIGSVLDARAENYNQSAGKLLDVSGNDFVGDQFGGVTLLTPRSHLSAGTLDLTNLPTSASGLSAGEVYNDSGTLKIV